MPKRPFRLGTVSTGWLREIGVETEDDLRRMGVVEAFRRVKANHPREATLNLLYGMEAALVGVHWKDLPLERKDELKREADAN